MGAESEVSFLQVHEIGLTVFLKRDLTQTSPSEVFRY
jgi:hypothetical protein